jgi:hypothetical protein
MASSAAARSSSSPSDPCSKSSKISVAFFDLGFLKKKDIKI